MPSIALMWFITRPSLRTSRAKDSSQGAGRSDTLLQTKRRTSDECWSRWGFLRLHDVDDCQFFFGSWFLLDMTRNVTTFCTHTYLSPEAKGYIPGEINLEMVFVALNTRILTLVLGVPLSTRITHKHNSLRP